MLHNVPPQALNRAAAYHQEHYPEADETFLPVWPPPNLWLGVSVENQYWANRRIPKLLSTPAAVRGVSYEPALGPVDLEPWLFSDQDAFDGFSALFDAPYVKADSTLDWVISGGESGPNRRPADPDWFRSIRDQCQAAGVAYFHKQGNSLYPGQDTYLDGREHLEFPTGNGGTTVDRDTPMGQTHTARLSGAQ